MSRVTFMRLVLALIVAFLVAAPSWAQSYSFSSIPINWVPAVSFTDAPWTKVAQCTGGGAAVDDDITPELPLGFTFRFGTTNYTTVRIQSNGRLQFANTFCGYGTQTTGTPPTYPYLYPTGLPGGSSATVSRTMRIYGADLDPSAAGRVRYRQDGTAPNRRFIVTWDNVPEYARKGSLFEIQIILYESGEFDYQFKTFLNTSGGAGQVGWMLSATDYGLVPLATVSSGNKAVRFRPTATAVASFNINIGAAAASTCSPKSITITARDSSGTTLTGYTGTINITTSSAHGDWAIATGSGTLNNGTANDGAATYTFVAGDSGVVMLNLSNSHADDLTASVVDSSTPSTSSTSSVVNFRDNAFVITLDAIQVAGKPQSIGVALWRRDTTTGNCSIATGYTGSKALDAWITRDAQDPGGAAPAIGALSLPNTAPAVSPGTNNLALSFAAGVATISLATADVGKYVLNLRDDTRAFATGVDITGASTSITTRPFALGFTEIKQGGGTCSPASGSPICNPGGSATTGAKFVAAGDTFEATVAGYRWAAADDTNADGVPDAGADVTNNGTTPSYAWATTLSATTPITPVGGVTGALGGGTAIAAGSYSGGRAVAGALTYAEVGSVTLQANAVNYLGSPGVNLTGTSPSVGRFFPGAFVLLGGSTTTAACVAGGFTYMAQSGIALTFIIEAQTAAGARTQNFASPGYTTGTVSAFAENNNAGVDLSARLSLAAGTWTAGRYTISAVPAMFSRLATPDGPYDNLQIGARVNDADGAVLAMRNMDPATTGDCVAAGTCTGVAIGATTKLRFGRLRIGNANGSELLPLAVPVEAQYWNGVGFTRNTDDSCTTLAAGNVALGPYTQRSGAILAPTPTAITLPAGALSSGTKLLTLSAPGAGKGGTVDLAINLGAISTENLCIADGFTTSGANLPWLRGRWCAASYDRDPTARATFGVYRGAASFVFQRENY